MAIIRFSLFEKQKSGGYALSRWNFGDKLVYNKTEERIEVMRKKKILCFGGREGSDHHGQFFSGSDFSKINKEQLELLVAYTSSAGITFDLIEENETRIVYEVVNVIGR